jgi:hypothetical protein
VDGRASIDDIAAALAPQLPDSDASVIKDAVRAVLAELHRG